MIKLRLRSVSSVSGHIVCTSKRVVLPWFTWAWLSFAYIYYIKLDYYIFFLLFLSVQNR